MTPPPPTLQELIDIVRQDAGSAESLDLLVTAASAVAQLEETGDALLGHFVDRCRRDGNSWSQISQALGVTKQAVHKRFAVAADQLIAANPEPTLEHFTDRARRVLAAAVREAAPAAASSAHVLLAQFAQPEGLAARALEALGITEAAVRAATQAARSPVGSDSPAGPPQPASPPAAPSPGAAPSPAAAPSPVPASSPTASAGPGQPASSAHQSDQSASRPRFTQDGHHLLRDAVAVALELGHNYIGTEHLLLASYRHRDGEAAKVLRALGATETATTDLVTGMLAGFRQTR